MNQMLILSFVGIFCFFSVIMIFIMTLLRKNYILSGRLAKLSTAPESLRQKLQNVEEMKQYMHELLNVASRIFTRLKLLGGAKTRTLSDRLASAGWRGTQATVIYLLIRYLVIIGFIPLMIWFNYAVIVPRYNMSLPLFFVVFGILLGRVLTEHFLRRAIKKYRNNVRKALPDAIDLMIICIEAGYTNDNTLMKIAEEFQYNYPELAEELEITSTELKILPDRRLAWTNLAKRTDLIEMQAVVTAIQQNDKYGTPLAKTFQTQVEVFRRDRIHRAEKKAARLPIVLLMPTIVFIFPIILVIIISPGILRMLSSDIVTRLTT